MCLFLRFIDQLSASSREVDECWKSISRDAIANNDDDNDENDSDGNRDTETDANDEDTVT